jgi:hypothetical protein
VRLNPLGTSVTVWPVVPAPDYDGLWWMWNSRWNDWQGKPKYSRKPVPMSLCLPQMPHDLCWNPGHRGGNPVNMLKTGRFELVLDFRPLLLVQWPLPISVNSSSAWPTRISSSTCCIPFLLLASFPNIQATLVSAFLFCYTLGTFPVISFCPRSWFY